MIFKRLINHFKTQRKTLISISGKEGQGKGLNLKESLSEVFEGVELTRGFPPLKFEKALVGRISNHQLNHKKKSYPA